MTTELITNKLKEIIARYPDKKSAIMNALYLVQEDEEYISEKGMTWVAEQLNVPPSQVLEIATFYSMFRLKRVGEYHIKICRTLSCMLAGAKDLVNIVRRKLNLKPGEISVNGLWSYEEVECLGSCGSGPAVMINDVLFEHLTPEKLLSIMGRIECERPDLNYSTLNEHLGNWL